MAGDQNNRQISLAEAMSKLPAPDGKRFASMFQHGSLLVEIYAPRDTDPQHPHIRDEVYVIVSGNGQFLNGSKRTPFQTGDVLFVPAGMEHRFEHFSDDLAVWVFFYGPEGGEKE